MTLYKYDYIESKLVKSRITIASIKLTDELSNNMSLFKDMRTLRDGILFARSVSFDGEWDGLYVTSVQNIDIPSEYILRDLGCGIYYVTDVPSLYDK